MPIRLCLEDGCPEPAVRIGRCAAHARARDRETHLRKSFYNSAKWRYTRRRQLHMHPLCECGAIATDVDHIRPIERGGDPWSFDNLSSMCKSCHSAKTRREQQSTTRGATR